jgi:hypothetical protein
VTRPAVSSRRIWAARLIAVAADGAQIVFLPFFGVGFLSPANDAIDLAMAVILTALVGWHWAFLPTLLAEVIPGVSLVPTWTAAVLLATWRRA